MRMETADWTSENIEKIGELFPNVITEARGEDGELKKAINFEALRQELSADVLEGDEAYEFTWVVDPLDGTTNFIHNNAPYCVSIALRSKEELLVGVVYEVCRDELYWTYKGAPSYLNNKEIHVSDVSDMDEAFVALGFPYDSQKYKPLAEHIVHELYGNVGGMRLQGAAAAELCYVAAGRFEARIEGLLGPWDIAAGSIILMNAGGKVTDYSGGGDFYSGREVLATNGKLHDEFLKVLGKK